MSWIDQVGDFINTNFLGGANQQAADAQVAAGNQAQNIVTKQYDQGQQYQQPYFSIGQQNLGTLNQNVNTGQYNQTPFQAPTEQEAAQTPGYQFALHQGLDSIQNSAASNGAGLSGATLKALQRYGTGLANQNYQNVYNNKLNSYTANANQLQNQFNRQAGMANYGIGAANSLGNMSTNYGNTMADIYGQQGIARASGIMGRSNAIQNTTNQVLTGVGNMFAPNQSNNNQKSKLYNQTKQPYYNAGSNYQDLSGAAAAGGGSASIAGAGDLMGVLPFLA